SFLGLVPLDVVDGLTDRLDLLGLVVGDGDLELLFQLHDQLDDVERVGPHVLLELRLPRDLFLAHAQVLAHYVDNAFFNGSHGWDLPKHSRFNPWGPATFRQAKRRFGLCTTAHARRARHLGTCRATAG